MSRNKFLITQSLLGAWGWLYKTENGYADFMKTLRREPVPPNSAMLDGRQFENMVTAYCEGSPPKAGHKWEAGIRGVGDLVRGGAFQVKLSKNAVIDNVEVVLYGILDVLKCGTIWDIKFSKTYHAGKYLDSPQHPMYFALCPEAREFTYVISNGRDVCREGYFPADTPPIEEEIRRFMQFLDRYDLVDTYCENWRSKY